MIAPLGTKITMPRRPVITLPDEDGDFYLVDGLPVRRWHAVEREARLSQPMPDHPAALRNIINAKHRGKQIHDAVALILEGKQFDPELLADESLPYVMAFLTYWTECRPLHLGQLRVEEPLWNRDLAYCCTPDFLDDFSINEIKTTDRPSRCWGLQTAAQSLAQGDGLERRVIWLRPKRKSCPYEVLTPSDPRVFSVYDYDVVREATAGDYDGPATTAWRKERP